jgi:hypothetical protein
MRVFSFKTLPFQVQIIGFSDFFVCEKDRIEINKKSMNKLVFLIISSFTQIYSKSTNSKKYLIIFFKYFIPQFYSWF